MLRNRRLTALRWKLLLGLLPTTILGGCGGDSDQAVAPPSTVEIPPREVASRLPTLAVQTANGVPIVSKDIYVAGSFTLTDTTGVRLTEGALEIRGRGHNGAYQGVYQLTEHVRIAPERVNIPEMKSSHTSAAAITGGYLIEVDERWGEAFCFKSGVTPMVFCLSNPETLNEPAWVKQKAYIQDYMRQVDAATFGPQFANPTTGYAAFIDVESAINYYILNELFKNVDGNLRLSTYLYKKRGGLLTFGPVWDLISLLAT